MAMAITPAPVTAPCWPRGKRLIIMRLRYGEDFAGAAQAIGYGESLSIWRRHGQLSSRRPRARLGPGRDRSKRARVVASGDYKTVPDPTCVPSRCCPCELFITEATFGLPVFRHGDPDAEIGKLLRSVALFPERAHLVGAYPLGKAQRLIALLRQAGYGEPIYLHGAMEKITGYYERRGIALGRCELARDAESSELARRHSSVPAIGAQRGVVAPLPRSGACFASGWMRVRARARQHLVELPLVISDHADWDGSHRHHCQPLAPRRSGSPTARRTRWCIGASGGAARATSRHRRLRR